MDPNTPSLGWQLLSGKSSHTATKPQGAARIDRFSGLAQALFEESSDAWVLCDLSTERVLDVNAAAQRLCGIDLRKLLDSPLSILLSTEDGASIPTILFPARRIRLRHTEHGLNLRTAQDNVWIPVDVSVVRLSLKPNRLALLSLHPIDLEHSPKHRRPHTGVHVANYSDTGIAATVDTSAANRLSAETVPPVTTTSGFSSHIG